MFFELSNCNLKSFCLKDQFELWVKTLCVTESSLITCSSWFALGATGSHPADTTGLMMKDCDSLQLTDLQHKNSWKTQLVIFYRLKGAELGDAFIVFLHFFYQFEPAATFD